jgi:hypothetical protein
VKKLTWDDHSTAKALVLKFLATMGITSQRQIKAKFKSTRDDKLLNYALNANNKNFGYSEIQVSQNNKLINLARLEITQGNAKSGDLNDIRSEHTKTAIKSLKQAKNSIKSDVLNGELVKVETRGRKKLPKDKKMVVGQFTIEPAQLEKLRSLGSVSVIVRELVLKHLDERGV